MSSWAEVLEKLQVLVQHNTRRAEIKCIGIPALRAQIHDINIQLTEATRARKEVFAKANVCLTS